MSLRSGCGLGSRGCPGVRVHEGRKGHIDMAGPPAIGWRQSHRRCAVQSLGDRAGSRQDGSRQSLRPGLQEGSPDHEPGPTPSVGALAGCAGGEAPPRPTSAVRCRPARMVRGPAAGPPPSRPWHSERLGAPSSRSLTRGRGARCDPSSPAVEPLRALIGTAVRIWMPGPGGRDRALARQVSPHRDPS